jgi:HprK-related kinase A
MRIADLTPSELAEQLRGRGVTIACGPLLIRLGASMQEVVSPLALLYGDYPIADEENIPDFEARVEPVSRLRHPIVPYATALLDGRRVFDPFPRTQGLPMLEWAINWGVFTRPNHHLMLHSAVVERGGSALLLSGQPGAGKSTLTAGLLFRGWRLLSDEVAMMRPGEPGLLPVPRPVGLKDRSIDIVRGLSADAVLGPASEGTTKGTVAHLRPPPEAILRASEPANPRWVVFPRYEQGASLEVRKVSRPEAMLRLGDEAFNYSVLGSVGFETLAAMVEGCACYSLRFGDLEEALEGLTELTASEGPRVAAPAVVSVPVRQESAQRPARVASSKSRRRVENGGSLLLEVLRTPARALELDAAKWTTLIGLGRNARLLARIALMLDEAGVTPELPPRVQEQLSADRPIARQHERIIRWEVGRIREALRERDTKVVLLKGAAYLMAGLPAGLGRLVSDVDILVPRGDIRRVEDALLSAGWQHVKLEPYDQRYYREWSHELPPLQHGRRGSMVDVHHNILPVSGRLHPDAEALLEAAVPIGEGLWTLGPEDMVLHAAAHLFQDGDLAGAVRDLVDLDALLRHFGDREPGFWGRLVERAQQMQLERPLFYALRYASRMLDVRIPEGIRDRVSAGAPAAPVRLLMDLLVARALLPVRGDRGGLGEETARMLLYARSHWLRMPPGRLAAHLARKLTRQWRGNGSQR